MKLWISLSLAASFVGSAFALPISSDLVSSMGMGYNIGNTMEVPAGPTAWGNSFPTAEYVKSIKAAGFNTVRIPCAWDSHAKNGVINAGWLDSVKTVVDLVVNEGMYAIVNIHWDSGWLEDEVFDGEHPDRNNVLKTTKSDSVAALQKNYWTQIATKFADYDEHLIFASANEPGVNDPRNYGDAYNALSQTWKSQYTDNGQFNFTSDRMLILKKYHEACLQAVRETGGNNATRTIVVQMPRTEIDEYSLLANNYPTDPAGSGYTMAEAHFYPYQYSLMTADADWGSCFYYFDGMNSSTDTKHNMGSTTESLGSKAHIDAQFDKLQSAFTSQGIPVIIGEMGAIKRLEEIIGDNLRLHLEGRAAWYGYVASAAKSRGIIPCIWDTGDEGNGNMTVIRRQTDKFAGNVGDIVDYEVLNAMRKVYDMDTLAGNSIDKFVEASLDTSDKMLRITYTFTRSDSAETGTLRINLNGANWSDYVAISFQAKVGVTSNGPCSNESCSEYGWTSLALFAMSGSGWTWKEANIDTSEISSAWKTYKVSLDASGLELVDKSDVEAIGLNVYGTQVTGTIEMDNIVLYKADGSEVVLENFNKKLPDLEGIASGELVASTNAVKRPAARTFGKMSVSVQPGAVNASFVASASGRASLSLVNSNGQIVSSKTFTMNRGTNSVLLEANYRGPGFLILKQNGNRVAMPVRLK